MSHATRFCCLLIVLELVACSLQAGPIQIADARVFIHDDTGLLAQLDTTSGSYVTTLDGNNLGTFGWSFSNSTAFTLNNVRFSVFLDADLDRSTNTFFNEYGTFLSLALPPGAPGGAIAASSWEIDEPGFVFGNIFNNLIAGSLDNSNGVPSSSPDDVSMALGFALGPLPPGQTATVTALTSAAHVGGLLQSDPGSNFQVYFNGYAQTAAIPEPGTALLCGVTLCGLFLGLLRRG